MEHLKPPKDADRKAAAGRGWQKSLTASARFCTGKVTLPAPPWEKRAEQDAALDELARLGQEWDAEE